MNNYLLSDKTTYNETPKMRWFKGKKYEIQGDFILPIVSAQPTEYYPLNLYKKDKDSESKYSQSPHQIFANIDISDNKEIEDFYFEYGPLGFYNHDVIKLVTYDPINSNFKFPGQFPIAGVLRSSVNIKENYFDQTSNIIEPSRTFRPWMLLPIDDLISKYDIPKSVFEKLNFDNIEFELPNVYINPFDMQEALGDFKRECTQFKFLMEINNCLEITPPNVDKLRLLLKSSTLDIKGADLKSLVAIASSFILFHVNIELDNRITPSLDWDETEHKLSRNTTWRCDSLLTAMYLMLFLDITKSNFNTKCAHCGKWFYAERSHGAYCGDKRCKWNKNTENLKYKKELLKRDQVFELYKLDNSIKDVAKITSVRKTTINRWINEMEMNK